MDERQVIVGGLSAAVVSAFEMGLDAGTVRDQLVGTMASLGVAGDASILDDVISDIDNGPHYPAGHPMAPKIQAAELAAKNLVQAVAAEIRDGTGSGGSAA
ncbi:hypothetical protein [Catenuloplanes japonicus]|uniref:hypothetical protein n=1 Tax=Catenuloplanes japonicus TaxID=33876 RepID=UPI000525FBCB|nr:hypothetical protein [Catenuloplanes japonicus]